MKVNQRDRDEKLDLEKVSIFEDDLSTFRGSRRARRQSRTARRVLNETTRKEFYEQKEGYQKMILAIKKVFEKKDFSDEEKQKDSRSIRLSIPEA